MTTEQIIEKYLDNVNSSFNQVKDNTYCIHSISSEHRRKHKFAPIDKWSKNIFDYFIYPDQTISIYPFDKTTSIILSGLENNIVHIEGKINHLIIRKSFDSNIEIKAGTISGIDILNSKYICLHSPIHNYTNLEYDEDVKLEGILRDYSQIHSIGCMDIKLNDKDLPINVFSCIIYTLSGIHNKESGFFPNITVYA